MRCLLMPVMAILCLALSSAQAQVTDMPDFEVPSRVDQFEYQPCMACHEYTEPNPNWRYLEEAPHYATVEHGNAKMWCTQCHSLESRDMFVTPSGQLIDMDKGYIVCAQCHNDVYTDWMHGAHGKRIGTWHGKRVIQSCMACHNPHHGPGIQPRRPVAFPGVRQGLGHQHQHRHRHQKGCDRSWEPCSQTQSEEQHDGH